MAEEFILVGLAIPRSLLEEYEPTGEVRQPLKGDLFWSPLRGQVMEAKMDETRGGPRVILMWRGNDQRSNLQLVRPEVPERDPVLRFPRKEADAEASVNVPEVPPGEQEDK